MHFDMTDEPYFQYYTVYTKRLFSYPRIERRCSIVPS